MAKVRIPITITVEAELDKFGRVRINSATWPNLAQIEQEFLKLSAVKQALIRSQIRVDKG